MSKRNARLRCKSVLGSRPSALAGIALAGITALAAISLMGQEKAQKDTSKDKELSVTVHGPETDAGLIVSARATAKEVACPFTRDRCRTRIRIRTTIVQPRSSGCGAPRLGSSSLC